MLTSEQLASRRPGPCIRCGWCLADCPVGLDPPALLEAVEVRTDEHERIREIARLYPHACVDCGVCSYVCPAGLPLAEGAARARSLVSLSS